MKKICEKFYENFEKFAKGDDKYEHYELSFADFTCFSDKKYDHCGITGPYLGRIQPQLCRGVDAGVATAVARGGCGGWQGGTSAGVEGAAQEQDGVGAPPPTHGPGKPQTGPPVAFLLRGAQGEPTPSDRPDRGGADRPGRR